ncbi:MAG: hypothetical protein E7665_01155 [Ruminococcaceae bacterium]|nr:hypothetical protein [Oscillospiraceae bacterium]
MLNIRKAELVEKALLKAFAFFLSLLLVLFAISLPIAFKYASSGQTTFSSSLIVNSLTDILGDGNYIYITIISGIVFSTLKALNIISFFPFTVVTVFDLSFTMILSCLFGVLFMTCSVKIELFIYSKILFLFGQKYSKALISIISPSASIFLFLLCNIISGAILNSSEPVLIYIACIIFLSLFILTEKQSSKERYGGNVGFFGNLSILNVVFTGVLKAVFTGILMYFIYSMGTRFNNSSLPYFAIDLATVYYGFWCTINTLAEDIKVTKKFYYSAVSLLSFVYLCASA